MNYEFLLRSSMLERIFIKKRKVKKRRISRVVSAKEEKIYRQHRAKAEQVLKKRTQELAHTYGFEFNRVSIKNTRTRWGSCSTKKNINLHYKLIFLKDEYRDYVIVHELCHLRQMNHSQAFWDEVEAIMPAYKGIAQKMRNLSPRNVQPAQVMSEQE